MDAMPSSGAVCKTDGVSYVESVEKNVKFHPVIQKHGKEIVYQVLRMPEMVRLKLGRVMMNVRNLN